MEIDESTYQSQIRYLLYECRNESAGRFLLRRRTTWPYCVAEIDPESIRFGHQDHITALPSDDFHVHPISSYHDKEEAVQRGYPSLHDIFYFFRVSILSEQGARFCNKHLVFTVEGVYVLEVFQRVPFSKEKILYGMQDKVLQKDWNTKMHPRKWCQEVTRLFQPYYSGFRIRFFEYNFPLWIS